MVIVDDNKRGEEAARLQKKKQVDTNAFAEGDGVKVLTHVGRFVSVSPSMEAVSQHAKKDAATVSSNAFPSSTFSQEVPLIKQQAMGNNLVSSSLYVSCSPGTANVVDLFGVSLNTLGYINNLTKDIQLGKYAMWSDLPSEKHSEVMDTIWVTNIDDTIHVDESPIVQFVIVLDMPNFYACAAGGSKPIPSRSKSEPSKAKANFHSLFSENVCEGANVTIPRKVVEMSLTMGVPLIEGLRYSVETVTIEYEWKPPCCYLCKIFGHAHDYCPKKVSIPPTVVTSNVATSTIEKTNDGFQTMTKKKKK
ncbi:hypothetical protein Tco_1161589, partial [Tanacetum coccineum]